MRTEIENKFSTRRHFRLVVITKRNYVTILVNLLLLLLLLLPFATYSRFCTKTITVTSTQLLRIIFHCFTPSGLIEAFTHSREGVILPFLRTCTSGYKLSKIPIQHLAKATSKVNACYKFLNVAKICVNVRNLNGLQEHSSLLFAKT